MCIVRTIDYITWKYLLLIKKTKKWIKTLREKEDGDTIEIS